MRYSVGLYRCGDGRPRWAVLGPGNVWYFPEKYGKRAAEMLAARMNRECV